MRGVLAALGEAAAIGGEGPLSFDELGGAARLLTVGAPFNVVGSMGASILVLERAPAA